MLYYERRWGHSSRWGLGGRAARTAGGDACTGGCTDDQRRCQLLQSRSCRRWRRGARKMQQRLVLDTVSEVRYPGEKETPLGEKEAPLGETLTPLFLQGLVLGPQ